jgi:hypothetical protein
LPIEVNAQRSLSRVIPIVFNSLPSPLPKPGQTAIGPSPDCPLAVLRQTSHSALGYPFRDPIVRIHPGTKKTYASGTEAYPEVPVRQRQKGTNTTRRKCRTSYGINALETQAVEPIKTIIGSQPKVSISGLGEGFNPAWSTHFGSPGRMLKLGDGSVAIIGIRLDTKEDTEQAAQENQSRVQATLVA